MAVNNVNNDTSGYYQSISSGKRIHSAADDPAGLSIAEKMTGQVNGYEVGAQNAQAGNDLLKIADAGLSSITDSLQRIRELSLQATNLTYSQTERDMVQKEIDQLKQSIQDAAGGTEYNTKKLLDGSMADVNLATNPNGGGMTIQMENTTLQALGIEDYDVSSGNFDIKRIDDALAKVMDSRSSLGSAANALEHNVNNNNVMSENLTSSRSKIEDEDVAKAISDQKKNQALEDYKMFTLKEKQLKDQNFIQQMFT